VGVDESEVLLVEFGNELLVLVDGFEGLLAVGGFLLFVLLD
jgi:hypothetical protein